MNKHKRGQSEIITTVLIILLVLAAIIIVWQVVKSTVQGGADTLEEQGACIGIGLDIASRDSANDKITITRTSGGADDAVLGVKVLVKGVSVPDTNCVVDGTANTECKSIAIKQLESKTLNLTGTGLFGASDKIEIAPILSGGSVCNIADTSDAD